MTETENDRPWTDRELIKHLYKDRRMSAESIADELDCGATTIRMWLEKHGIEKRSMSEAVRLGYGNHPKEVPLHVKKTGAVRWNYSYKGEKRTVFVHRLLAVAIWGFEAVRDHDVHHKNEVRWDNRPGNLELMEHGEHSSHHRKLTEKERRTIVQRYKDGESSYDIAPDFDVTPGTAIQVVREHDEKLVRPMGRREAA